jgi:uncharacterized protein YqjF (DUF2071 family)
MGQTWRRLLFMHWRVEPAALEGVVPPGLQLDLRDGAAWLGITPFLVEGLRLRGTPPPPVISRFAEVNVRTYVSYGGKPGIYFLSLDATSRLAVAAARRAYRLPYFHSRAELDEGGGSYLYRSARISKDGPPAELRVRYRPASRLLPSRDDALERWLAERYCLYTLDDKRDVLRGEIHHPAWPLREAEGEVECNTMTAGFPIELEREPLMHYADRQDVILWSLEHA